MTTCKIKSTITSNSSALPVMVGAEDLEVKTQETAGALVPWPGLNTNGEGRCKDVDVSSLMKCHLS